MKPILIILYTHILLFANQFDIDAAKRLDTNLNKCDQGDVQACLDAGGEYQYGQEDNPKLFVYYKKACELNDSYGCWKLGHSYREISMDLKKAKETFIRSCELGNLQGCIDAGLTEHFNELMYQYARKLLHSKDVIRKKNSLGTIIYCTKDMKLCKTENEVSEFYYLNKEGKK
jgi:TPR repeat protein